MYVNIQDMFIHIYIHDTLIWYVFTSYGRNYIVVGENAINKCRGSPIGFASFEYGLWGIVFFGVPCRWSASMLKATSYYSVHPLILWATHICIRIFVTLSPQAANTTGKPKQPSSLKLKVFLRHCRSSESSWTRLALKRRDNVRILKHSCKKFTGWLRTSHWGGMQKWKVEWWKKFFEGCHWRVEENSEGWKLKGNFKLPDFQPLSDCPLPIFSQLVPLTS